MKSKKKPLIFGLLVVIIGMVIAIIAAMTSGGGKDASGKPKTVKDVDKVLRKSVNSVTLTKNYAEKGTVTYDDSFEAVELPDINKTYPLVENPVGCDVVVEIFSSPEKAGTGTDGWMLEMAKEFNRQNNKIDGKSVGVKLRSISSGTQIDYILSGSSVPAAISPSASMWCDMLESQGIEVHTITDRTVGNVAGVLVDSSTYSDLEQKYGTVDINAIVSATLDSTLTTGYTNPLVSTTGLNFLASVLYNFDSADPLGNKAVDGFKSFQDNIPFVAYNTLQMRTAAENGTFGCMMMEYQSYIQDVTLSRNYKFVPFGIRHDNPLTAVGKLSDVEMKTLEMFADLCKSDKAKKLADEYGFNKMDDYKGDGMKIIKLKGVLTMDGKYIKRTIKRITVPLITLIFTASALSGCSSSSKSQVIDTVNELGADTQIEFLIEENAFEEKGTPQEISWVPLAKVNTYSGFRGRFESAMGIESKDGVKSGCVYVGQDGKITENATLKTAFSNKATFDQFNDKETQDYLRTEIKNTYADVEDNDEYAAIINAYFNLLPDNTPNYFNGAKSLNRLEAMSVLTRATKPVNQSSTNTQDFVTAVGETKFSTYAALSNDVAFISTNDGSLTQDNATKAMSKGEFVYIVMSSIYGEDTVSSVDLSTSKLTDIKDVVPTKNTKTNAEQLALALQTPTQAPEAIYKALVLANENGLVEADTQWNTAITKSEAIALVTDAIQSYNEKNGFKVNDKGVLTDTESKAEAEAKEKEELTKLFDTIKDEVTCDLDTFIKEYKEITKDKKVATGEAIETIKEKYKKPVETTAPTTTEAQTTTQAVQQPQDNGNNNGGGGTPQYVEPPQQQVTEPVYVPPVTEPVYTPPVETPTQPPVVTPPSNGGGDSSYTPPYDPDQYDVGDASWDEGWQCDEDINKLLWR